MKVSLSWLREFVDLDETPDVLRPIFDDLGLVVDGIEYVGQGLDGVVVSRIDEVQNIEGADRVRRVVVDAGDGPIEIVCGATNFSVGDYVPLAPVGAVLPGGFEIARRSMRGVTSNGMLCSARELGLSDDHLGLMLLSGLSDDAVGRGLIEVLNIVPDVVFDITVEGNRPDAWSVEGVARDLATRFSRSLRAPSLAQPNGKISSDLVAHAGIDAPDLCGRLTVSVLRNVKVGPSPDWMATRLLNAGMRPISNVVDASNMVMLELGQPTHPYDADHVAGRTLRARRARVGERLVTLDGTERELARAARGLGDTGEDCVIVDRDDVVLGLAGIMGGATSEISESTTEVLLEAAFFDPMTIARSSKRHGLRSEASNRFERGVDPHLALRAAARFVALLRESVPDLEWLPDPLDVWGSVPTPPTIELRHRDIERLLGVDITSDEATAILQGLNFTVTTEGESLIVTAPSARLDVRSDRAGRADVIEEIARLHGYRRLPRRTPTWPEPGRLTTRQQLRRRVRDVLVDLGAFEVWTPTLGSDEEFDLLHPGVARVRITNPLASEESVMRATMLTGLVRAWGRNIERGTGDVTMTEIGTVFAHPSTTEYPRATKGGDGGTVSLKLPSENERVSVLLGRTNDDATSAVATWFMLAERIGLDDTVIRQPIEMPPGLHPTRSGALVDRTSGAVLGYVGEIDERLMSALVPSAMNRRVGVLDIDFDLLADPTKATRRSDVALVPSRFPSAAIDLALVTPLTVHAADLALALRLASELIEEVSLFDVYRGSTLRAQTRSLAFNIRFSAPDRTLGESEIASTREVLIDVAKTYGATLRGSV